MSKILPYETIAAYRNAHNVVLGVYGIDVTLYLANNLTDVENLDAYQTQDDITYTSISTQVFIDWKPSQNKLRKLGLYNEGDLPILCHIPNSIDVPIKSYLKIPVQFLPQNSSGDQTVVNEFEIVNRAIPHIHNIEIFQTYSIVPKRIPTNAIIIDGTWDSSTTSWDDISVNWDSA